MCSIIDGIIIIYTELKKSEGAIIPNCTVKEKNVLSLPGGTFFMLKMCYAKDKSQNLKIFFLNKCFTVCVPVNVKYSNLNVKFISLCFFR